MKEYDVYRLSDFYDIISGKPFGNKPAQPIWFRGQRYNHYYLLPTLQRDFIPTSNDVHTYNQSTLSEFERYQSFAAKTTHCVDGSISSKLEWEEVYQHYLGKTRMMDWSESAKTALSFALESYLNPKNDAELSKRRRNCTPVVWMLNPRGLNEKVYDFFSSTPQGKRLTERAIKELKCTRTEKEKILNSIGEKQKELYLSIPRKNSTQGSSGVADESVAGILSLCVLDDYRESNMSRMPSLVKTGEFNPFYYLCLRYYSDALPCRVGEKDMELLPPLAILQPYHSERIRTQRGTFTIFPNYDLDDELQRLYKTCGYDVRKMENQKIIQDCLMKINILNPTAVARDLILSGERRSELYPDIEVYIETIEADEFYV